MADKPNCPCCKSPKTRHWADARDVEYDTATGTFEYCRCEACGCLFIHPVPLHQLARIYPPDYYSYAIGKPSLTQRIKDWLDARMMRSLLAGIHGAQLAALDIGGGAGQQLTLLRNIDPRITHTEIVDLDANAQAQAEAAGHRYFCGPIESFTTERRYDLILMLNIIEHVADPGRVLAAASQLLTPQGIVVIKTPNVDSLDARLFRHRNWTGYHCPRHWVLFNAKSFEQLSLQSGLRVMWQRFTQGAPFWAGSLVHLLAPATATAQGRYRRVVDHPLYAVFCGIFAAFDLLRAPFSTPSQMLFALKQQTPTKS